MGYARDGDVLFGTSLTDILDIPLFFYNYYFNPIELDFKSRPNYLVEPPFPCSPNEALGIPRVMSPLVLVI